MLPLQAFELGSEKRKTNVTIFNWIAWILKRVCDVIDILAST